MMYQEIWGLFFLILVLFVTRWAFIVSEKLPLWLENDWEHQAKEFLNIEPLPDKLKFSWWTPFRKDKAEKFLYYLPIVGPFLEKRRLQSFFELFSIFVSLLLLASPSDFLFFGIVFYGLLLCLSLIDLKTMLLPDVLVYPFLWAGVFKASLDKDTTSFYIMGLILGFFILFILKHVSLLLFKKDGMGGGDIKLFAGIGAWIGIDFVIVSLLLACIISILTYLVKKIFFKNASNVFPFGPSLSLSAFLIYLVKPYVGLVI